MVEKTKYRDTPCLLSITSKIQIDLWNCSRSSWLSGLKAVLFTCRPWRWTRSRSSCRVRRSWNQRSRSWNHTASSCSAVCVSSSTSTHQYNGSWHLFKYHYLQGGVLAESYCTCSRTAQVQAQQRSPSSSPICHRPQRRRIFGSGY